MTGITKVDDDELLYRRILADSDQYRLVDGKVIFTSTAFNDRCMKPSVDRSAYRADPEACKFAESDGVTHVVTSEVRGVSNIAIGPDDEKKFCVDAIHRPVDDPANPAHTQIECDPEMSSSSRFKKLKEALAILASKQGFVVEPSVGSAAESPKTDP